MNIFIFCLNLIKIQMAEFTYYNPVQIKFCPNGYLNELSKIMSAKSFRVGLFYGQNSFKKNGVLTAIKMMCNHCAIVEFGGISVNPSIAEIENTYHSLPELDWAIAVGGGSVIDFAKSVAFLSRQEIDLDKALCRENFKSAKPGVPVIAIPTTSGSGSEVTPWASLWDKENKKKYSLSHHKLFPEIAIIDPELTLTLPPFKAAICAFDALSHAFEAFWSIFANPVSDLYAMEAIRLIFENLEAVVQNPRDLSRRISLSRASLLAGLALSNTKTAAVHSVSYPMTLHFGLPHGLACSLTLAEFWRFNRSALDANKVALLMRCLGELTPESLYRKLKELAIKSTLPVTLHRARVPRGGISIILDEGLHPDRILNNPREVTVKDLKRILERIES